MCHCCAPASASVREASSSAGRQSHSGQIERTRNPARLGRGRVQGTFVRSSCWQRSSTATAPCGSGADGRDVHQGQKPVALSLRDNTTHAAQGSPLSGAADLSHRKTHARRALLTTVWHHRPDPWGPAAPRLPSLHQQTPSDRHAQWCRPAYRPPRPAC